jgi:hypothetical protein
MLGQLCEYDQTAFENLPVETCTCRPILEDAHKIVGDQVDAEPYGSTERLLRGCQLFRKRMVLWTSSVRSVISVRE